MGLALRNMNYPNKKYLVRKGKEPSRGVSPMERHDIYLRFMNTMAFIEDEGVCPHPDCGLNHYEVIKAWLDTHANEEGIARSDDPFAEIRMGTLSAEETINLIKKVAQEIKEEEMARYEEELSKYRSVCPVCGAGVSPQGRKNHAATHGVETWEELRAPVPAGMESEE